MTVQERILKVIARESHRELREEQLDVNFAELGVDSLDKVCILYGLEQEFGLKIAEEEAQKFTTVRQMIERLGGRADAPLQASATG